MPYIFYRSRYDDAIEAFRDALFDPEVGMWLVEDLGPGDFNYVVTQLMQWYIDVRGGARYEVFNELVGSLECSKLELYRRLVAPYEDTKIKENGDVY